MGLTSAAFAMHAIDRTYAPWLRAWRNEPEAVRWSKSGRPVGDDEHAAWMEGFEALAGKGCAIRFGWIGYLGGRAIGAVRFELLPQEVEISVVVAPSHRRLGLGKMLVQAGSGLLKIDHPDVHEIRALVHQDHMASRGLFERCGFNRDSFAETPEPWLIYLRTP